MAHNHSHSHNYNHCEGVSNVTLVFLLNFGFSILELVGGLITGSKAILSDAVHDFGDSIALALSFVFEKVGKRGANEKYTYGYKRISLIGAFINIIVLSVCTIFVFSEALQSLVNSMPVKAEGMLLLSFIGIAINGASVFRMKGSKKILDKTVIMHLMEDLLGWIAVLVVSIVIYFTNWYILDPILSLGICIIIGRNIYFNLKTAILIIMQRVPDEDLYEEIKEHLMEINEIEKVEKLNMWTMDGEIHVLTASIKTLENANKNEVLNKVKEMLNDEGINESTIEVL
ncbi:MAG: cation diffusion facilitator family transporter [Terrisporobacter othiniensis]|uniref:cation diffusion facilitator family transporter n=1 Tax=Terrisporobacter othiniensis TaxID=1577792 RepID=UPI00290D4611|nr:cation diffusion facilitator family transporter [Terrisporobacter othiniensis]MDU6984458.1 cation diffusion facilitator family transporter [Terrisporobacter othiniensis]